MRIQQIQQAYSFNTQFREQKRKGEFGEEGKKKPPVIKDTYESSQKPRDRKKLIADVKKRIQSGYYNSEEVTEDLSESFAKAFDKRL